MPPVRANAMDHVVLVLFENRSFDNLLGCPYTPGEVESFEGVVGKDFSNPVPDWAEHGAVGDVVPYGISVGMDAPDPDPGEEYPHTNTQRCRHRPPIDRDSSGNRCGELSPNNLQLSGRTMSHTAGCGRVIDGWVLAHRELSPTGTSGMQVPLVIGRQVHDQRPDGPCDGPTHDGAERASGDCCVGPAQVMA